MTTDDVMETLKKQLAELDERNRKSAEKQQCYIVIHRNYAEGDDAHAFFSRETARADVKADVEGVESMLQEQGYETRTCWYGKDGVEVYTPDRNIYYEWFIVLSTIE